MSIRFAHISDTHLGFQDLEIVNSEGINAREADIYRAWHTAVDMIIKEGPDVMVHTGDFFHRPCPTNRALIEGLSGLKKITEAGIPVVIIAGNHSTPRTIYTSPILKSLQSIDNVHPIFKETYEQLEINNVVFHGVPHINEENRAIEELFKATPVPGKINILMLHTSIGADYLMEEYGERVFPNDKLPFLDEFDYTALGHFHSHKHIKKSKSTWYSGASERFSEKDAGKEKGFLIVTIPESDIPDVEFIALPIRPWFRFSVENCHEKTVEEIKAEISEFSKKEINTDAIISLQLNNLKPVQSLNLSNTDLFKMFPGSFTVQTRRTFIEETFSLLHREIKKESLLSLFSDYTKEHADSEEEAKQLVTAVKKYFSAWEKEKTDAGEIS
ncbi:MAG: exonuclease SbcCD subunit D [Spirochaetales bacterium]|nr:exonuclease SbcCD subunit D [Spirochaetales bacterium]